MSAVVAIDSDAAASTRLLLVGATGLVGGQVLRRALADARVGRVVAPTRSPLPAATRLENPRVDFEHLPEHAPWWSADAVICALGTTMRRAGSQAAFRRVDHDYPLAVARLAKAHGVGSFVLVSAMGADPRSRVFYNRTKGEVEAAIGALGFRSYTVARPALIGGARGERGGFRPAERLGLAVVGTLGPLLPRAWRVNPAERIAAALLEAALRAEPGTHRIESAQMA